MAVDVVVVGAGAAGLAAARELRNAGKDLLVLEARGRAGGRISSLADPRSVVPIELGAEFVHGAPQATLALLHEIGATRCDVSDTHAEIRRGVPVAGIRDEEIDTALQTLLRRVGDLESDESVDAFLARFEDEPELRDAARWMRQLVEGFDASDPARASVFSIAQEWGSDAGVGAPESRPSCGYGPLVERLVQVVESERVLYGAIAERIEWSGDGVRVCGAREGEAFALDAGAAVVALPLGVLLSERLVFRPPLPPERRRAIEALAMGPVYKAVAVFAEPVWEHAHGGGLRDTAVMHDARAAFPTLWTSLPMRSSTLVAWAGGPHAARLAGMSDEERYECVFRSIDGVLGKGARDAVATIYLHDWQHDPFSCGAYSYVNAGGMGARERIAAPLGRLFFAGEATALGGEAGTVGGALQSGSRAAAELCEICR